MVQYAEIKSVEQIINNLKKYKHCSSYLDIDNAVKHLKKYHTILKGWYGNEQYHKGVDL